MERDRDPALNFFAEGEVDLYGALGVETSATQDEIKKAYRKLALRYHPDKVLSNTSDIDPHKKFQQINFAYGVVSDEKRRKRYDDTGRTDEPMFMEDGFSWDDYFKEMWQGNVSGSKLDEFKKNYQKSDEERQDVLEAYETAKGDLETMFTLIPCSEVLEDEARFVELIKGAIASGEVKELPQWKKSVKNESGRKKMREKARKEASEAEEYARELGVWDDLFGSKKASGSGTKRAKPAAGNDEVEVDGDASSDEEEGGGDDEEDDEAPVQKKRRVRKGAAPAESDDENDAKPAKGKKTSKPATASSSKGKKKSSTKSEPSAGKKKQKKNSAPEEEDDEEGLDGLRALMMKRGNERNQGFNAMIARLEAQAGGSGGKKGKGKGGPPMLDDPLGEDEPDEAAFLAAQAKVDAHRKQKQASGGASGSKSSSSESRKSR